MLKDRLQPLVDNPNQGAGRVFACFIQLTIIVSILDFMIETIPGLAPETRSVLHAIELISIPLENHSLISQ